MVSAIEEDMNKKEPMDHKGIRFSKSQWDQVILEAEKKKVNASDVVRYAVEFYMECKDDLATSP